MRNSETAESTAFFRLSSIQPQIGRLELALACARRAPLVLALELAAPASQARGPDLALEQEQGLEQEHAVEQALALERPE